MNRVKQRSFLLNTTGSDFLTLVFGAIFMSFSLIVILEEVEESRTDILIFGSIGLVIFIFGFVTLIRGMIRRREIKQLKRQNTFVIADVIGCKLSNIRVTKNKRRRNNHREGQPVYYLRCSYQSIYGETYIFKSDLLNEDPTPYLKGKVNVYCDEDYMKPYFVDVDGSIGLKNRVIEIYN
jgi:hypothetical protein